MPDVVVFSDAGSFLERAERWLREREDANNLFLSLAYARAAAPLEEERDVFYATVETDGEVVGCVMRTPPHKVLLTHLPAAAAQAIAQALEQRFETIPSVLGPREEAVAVAEQWIRVKGGGWSEGMHQRLYRLDVVDPPGGVEGRLRLAGSDDVDLTTEWGGDFTRETGVGPPPSRAGMAARILDGDVFVWDVGGEPRSMAVASGRTPRGVRVGYVYTPPKHRRHGYASGLVASLSQRLLDDGSDFCMLYTDLSNPTSNAIYERLGYRPLHDVVDIEVRPGG
ncbi:MAG: GNAT family N-acetyltransferase [Gemmatimonadetes bacterium]|nr:GNAT family N-acetyltransferase [Gemmatimonadota bacterium]